MKPGIIVFAVLLSGLIISGRSVGQSKFELPKNIELKTREDYSKYENAVVGAERWMEETDLDQETAKRQAINQFIVQWVAGSPTVTINLDESLAQLTEKNPDLLALYLASYSKYIIEHKNDPSNFNAARAALTSISRVYRKGIDVYRNKKLENLKDSIQIEEYIIRTLKISKT
jgi:hypothetical protein